MASEGKGIGWAVHCMQGGGKVRRPNKKGYFHLRQVNGELRIVYVDDDPEDFDLTVLSHADLLARDWEAVA